MFDRPIGTEMNCETFLEALEQLPGDLPAEYRAADWRGILPQPAREHALRCATCAQALEDFADTRAGLAPMKDHLAQPGPWFVSRVMAGIRQRERELQEQADGVWISVMRLAPRLSAFSALLLVLGSTWAVQLRREGQLRQQQRQVEGLFESAPSQLNDDILSNSGYEERQP